MHIAFLTPEYPNITDSLSGGLGTSIQNLASALMEKGLKVSIVLYDQKTDASFQKGGIDFHVLKKKKYKMGGWYLYRKYLQNFLNKLSKEQKVDIIEAADWTGITAFMKLDIPLVIRLHGSDTYFCALEGRTQKWKNNWFEKDALKRADNIITVSDFTGRKTMELFNMKRPYQTIPNGINVENFKPSVKDTGSDQIFYFGTLIRKKGILELAEIFNIVVSKRPGAKLVLAGRDAKDIKENKSTLKLFRSKLSEKALQNLGYCGEVPYAEIKSILEDSAVIVLPSFAEAFPMTWLEAMAMEKALVTSNIGWAEEIMIDGSTGYMVHPEDHLDYAEKILLLLSDQNMRIQMGREARKRVLNNFSSDLIADRNIKFYKSALKKSLN